VIATDETETREAQVRAEHEAAYSQAIIRIFKSRSRFFEFIRDSKTFFTRLEEELGLLQADWTRIARLVHTFKGASSYFSLLEMTRLAHDVETELQAQRHQESPSPKLRDLCGKLKESFEHFLNDHKDLLETEPDKTQRSVDISLDLLQAFEWVLTHTPEEELLEEATVDSAHSK
jgi:HPt (histidine-containing phosphotransfer) domain-containing protein